MTTEKKERAPTHLKQETARWWESVVADYTLEPHHKRLLTLAAEAWDRCEAARRMIDEKGLTFDDRHGQPRSRPEISVERDARLAFARLLREVDLDAEAPRSNESRPPQLSRYRGGSNAA